MNTFSVLFIFFHLFVLHFSNSDPDPDTHLHVYLPPDTEQEKGIFRQNFLFTMSLFVGAASNSGDPGQDYTDDNADANADNKVEAGPTLPPSGPTESTSTDEHFGRVNCGGHFAHTCAGCPRGNG